MAARPKLALGGLIKKATESNILEHGTGEQTGDITTLVAVERKVVLPTVPVISSSSVTVPKPKAMPAKPKTLLPSSASSASSAPKPKPTEVPVPKPELKSIDLTKYDEPLNSYAIDILSEEVENPYKDKSDSPIFHIQSLLGFQKQIFRVFSSFNKIPEF